MKYEGPVVESFEEALDLLNRYRWRSIAEMHEDHGPCVVMHIENPGYMTVEHIQDTDYGFDPACWTHFTQITPLSGEEGNKLLADYQRAAGRGK